MTPNPKTTPRFALVGCAVLLIFGTPLHAQPSNYDQRSWIDAPIPLAVDLSGIQDTQPQDLAEIYLAIVEGAQTWNRALGIPLFAPYQVTAQPSRSLGDGISGIYFTRFIAPNQNFGAQFGYADSSRAPNGLFEEADILFNPAHTWESYQGPLHYQPNGDRVAEIGRVTLHELGHTLGITHPQDDATETIMRSRMNDLDGLTALDLEDVRRIKSMIGERNLPTLDRETLRSLKKGTRGDKVRLKGASNPFISKMLFFQIRSRSGTKTTRIRARSAWTVRVDLNSGLNRIRILQRTALFPNRSSVRTIRIRQN
jgi:hypothetical protein